MKPDVLTPAEQELIGILCLIYDDPREKFLDIIELIYRQPLSERFPLVRSLVRWYSVIPVNNDVVRADPIPFSQAEIHTATDHLNTMVRIGILRYSDRDQLGTTADEIAGTIMSRLDMLAVYGRCIQMMWLGNVCISHPAIPVRDAVTVNVASEDELNAAINLLCHYPAALVEIESILKHPDGLLYDAALWITAFARRCDDPMLITAFTQYVIAKTYMSAIQAVSVDTPITIVDVPPDTDPIDPKTAN